MLKALTVSAVVAAASMAVMAAQSGPLKVASGHREILLQTTQSWNGQPTHTIPRVSRNSQRSN
jgi:hypothetical protein